jgi:hypothetical protein
MSRDLAIGDGWLELAADAIKEIGRIDPDVRVAQVKEKFGSLRIALNAPSTPEIQSIIMRAQELAGKTCTVCGNVGTLGLVDGTSYWTVRCASDAPEGWTSETLE